MLNKEDIAKIGLEAGLPAFALPELIAPADWVNIERFAQLVAAAEREACAKLCDDLDDDLPDGLAGWQYGEAIRARGQQ